MPDFVIRYVVTVPANGGRCLTLMRPAQGRHTYATPEEAQAWVDACLANNSDETLDQIGRDLQVRPCRCHPNHFDPMEVWFDLPDADSV